MKPHANNGNGPQRDADFAGDGQAAHASDADTTASVNWLRASDRLRECSETLIFSGDPDAEGKTKRMAEDLFQADHACAMAEADCARRNATDEIETNSAATAVLRKRLASTALEQTMVEHQEKPLARKQKFVLGTLLAASIGFMIVDINQIAAILIGSGDAVFENAPWRAYVFTMAPLLIPISLKGCALIVRRPFLPWIAGGSFIISLVVAICYLAVLCQASGSWSRGTGSDVEAAANGSLVAPPSLTTSGFLPFLAFIGSSFGAAACAILAQAMKEHRELRHSISNPAYEILKAEQDRLRAARRVADGALARATGRLSSLASQQRLFVDHALAHLRLLQQAHGPAALAREHWLKTAASRNGNSSKSTKSALAAAILIGLSGVMQAAQPAQGTAVQHTNYIIAASSKLSQEDRMLALRRTCAWLIEEAPADTRFSVFDIGNQLQITSGQVQGINSRSRLNRLQPQLAALRKFFTNAAPASLGNQSGPNVPKFLRNLNQLRNAGDGTAVLILASPFYGEGAFSMLEGHVPSDANFSDSRSPFHVEDRLALQNVSVHWVYFHEPFEHHIHEQRVARFWKHLVERRSGVLATFGPDLNLGFDRFHDGVRTPAVSAEPVDENDHEARMVRYSLPTRRESADMPVPQTLQTNVAPPKVQAESSEIPAEARTLAPIQKTATHAWVQPALTEPVNHTITNSAVVHTNVTPSAVARVTEEVVARVIPMPMQGMLQIAAVWSSAPTDQPPDVDLRAQVAGFTELYYSNVSNGAGLYFRDIQTSGSFDDQGWTSTWELIELKSGVVSPTNTTVWLNLYRGSGKSISGLYRIAHAGRVVTRTFSFDQANGDAGHPAPTRENSTCWIRIPLGEILTEWSHAAQFTPSEIPRPTIRRAPTPPRSPSIRFP